MNAKRVALLAGLVLACLGVTPGWAQTGGHTMVTPTDLKWAEVPSLPPGAKIAVIEGPLTEAVPFTLRLKLPLTTRSPRTGIRPSSTSR